jgi:hypothetical protein
MILNSLFGADVIIIEKSKPIAKIYIHPDEAKPVKRMQYYMMKSMPSELLTAVNDLNYHLEQMAGCNLEIIEESDPHKITTPAIVVGKLATQLGATCEATDWREDYRILVKDGLVLIGGERDVASSYGVYSFLQMLGCDWVMPGTLGEVIPQRATVTVDETDIRTHPDFGLRWMWIGGHPKHFKPGIQDQYNQWLKRQRLGFSEKYCERVNEAHIWNKVIRKYKKEFENNPEMLALVRQPDGTYNRQGPQIETTDPKTINLMVRYIREFFTEMAWSKDKRITLGIGPADGLDFSESPESLAMNPYKVNPISGVRDATDSVIKLANDILEKIGDEYPNLTLGFYVYSAHNDFPQSVVPNPRILPIFAPIGYSRLHSTLDPHSKTRSYYKQVVDKWVESAGEHNTPLMVYEYNWNLADNMLPYTRVKSMAEDIKFYKERGFFGMTIESVKAWATVAPQNYVFAKMSWNCSLNWEKVLAEFCDKSYGPAAKNLEQYYLRLAKIQSESGQEAGSYYSAPLIFNNEYMKAARADINKALSNKKLTEKQRKRVEGVNFGFHTLELYLEWNKASNEFDFIKATKIGEKLKTNYQATLDANRHFIGRAAGIYIDRLMLKSTESSLKYSSSPYKIIYKLPDQLPTMFDPTGNGDNLNLFGTKINDSGWLKTKTWSSTWDAQGLGLLRTGSVWYRTHFDVLAGSKGKGIGLLLGAFEDEAKVWVNGVYVGSTGIKFPQAATLDLTDGIIFGEKNLLTIEIKRNSKANELLLGGLLRPSFVFTGPRVKTPLPPKHRVRVLPGGELEIIK